MRRPGNAKPLGAALFANLRAPNPSIPVPEIGMRERVAVISCVRPTPPRIHCIGDARAAWLLSGFAAAEKESEIKKMHRRRMGAVWVGGVDGVEASRQRASKSSLKWLSFLSDARAPFVVQNAAFALLFEPGCALEFQSERPTRRRRPPLWLPRALPL